MNSCMYKLPTFQLTTTVNYNYNKGISVLTSTGLGSQNFVVTIRFSREFGKIICGFFLSRSSSSSVVARIFSMSRETRKKIQIKIDWWRQPPEIIPLNSFSKIELFNPILLLLLLVLWAMRYHKLQRLTVVYQKDDNSSHTLSYRNCSNVNWVARWLM